VKDLPTPPSGFGSYDPSEVTWLLSDLSDVELELDTATREKLVQSGGHYSEMLPVEFHPDQAYTDLFKASLAETAPRLAHAVALVGELVLRRHERLGTTPVLLSLARAGVPVGILLRRYYQLRGLDVPHYAISIVRGKGIDTVALEYVLARHAPEQLRFVDGWTGKGAITRELEAALVELSALDERFGRVDPELAVLADPGSCTTLHGTRDDFLIPSACLNSTVSGLVSRTVLREDLIKPGMFHGAKFYAELSDADVSAHFLDVVAEHLPAARDLVLTEVEAFEVSDREPTWTGWDVTEHLGRVHGITNVHLIKPGVGETTRVLLRRVPWKVLVRPDRAQDTHHVRVLCASRGVPVEVDPDLPYSCVGLIEPQGSDQ
jgi:hypothetical protein